MQPDAAPSAAPNPPPHLKLGGPTGSNPLHLWTPSPPHPPMKIATWNVNSLSVRLPQVLAWLATNPVDALCLQELKLTDDKFPHVALQDAGYHAVAFGQKT